MLRRTFLHMLGASPIAALAKWQPPKPRITLTNKVRDSEPSWVYDADTGEWLDGPPLGFINGEPVVTTIRGGGFLSPEELRMRRRR